MRRRINVEMGDNRSGRSEYRFNVIRLMWTCNDENTFAIAIR